MTASFRFSKTRQKCNVFGTFNELLSTQNVNVAGFARNIECDFFCDFQTPCALCPKSSIFRKNNQIRNLNFRCQKWNIVILSSLITWIFTLKIVKIQQFPIFFTFCFQQNHRFLARKFKLSSQHSTISNLFNFCFSTKSLIFGAKFEIFLWFLSVFEFLF